jgi:hypothetical protein
MNLHDFIPGLAYRTVCLYGFPPQTSQEWRAACEMLMRCFERIGVKPNTITVDNAPGLSDAAMPADMWRMWLARHEFPAPSALSAGSGYLGRLRLRTPWLHTRAHGNIHSREAFDVRPNAQRGGLHPPPRGRRSGLRNTSRAASRTGACGLTTPPGRPRGIWCSRAAGGPAPTG